MCVGARAKDARAANCAASEPESFGVVLPVIDAREIHPACLVFSRVTATHVCDASTKV